MRTDQDSSLFLGSPADIQREIRCLIKGSRSMKVAVAFIGRQKWSDLFQDYRGKVQVICWLDTVNTDPYAVEGMKEQRDKFEVKQIDSMHAKVYLAPGAAAVVGSANLSTPALANSTSGQHEAAVLVRRREIVNEIGQWFDEKWRSEARDITPDDFARAKAKYDAARAARSDNLDSIRLVGGPTKPGMADAVVTSAADSSMQGPVSSTDDVTVPQFTPISTMPMSPVDGRPLYRGGRRRRCLYVRCARGNEARDPRTRSHRTHNRIPLQPSFHARRVSRGALGYCD